MRLAARASNRSVINSPDAQNCHRDLRFTRKMDQLIQTDFGSVIFSDPLSMAMTRNSLCSRITMAFVSIHQRSRAALRLRWTAFALNGAVIAMGATSWMSHVVAKEGLFPPDALSLVVVGAANIACIGLSRQFLGAKACPGCGYNLRSLRCDGCPECGWQRDPGT